MNKGKTTTSGSMTLFMPPHNVGSSIEVKTLVSGEGNKEVWTHDFQNTSYPLVFLAPVSEEDTKALPALPSDHPIWDEIDALLARIWSESDYVDPAVDDAWLEETRSSWNERLDDWYDESDTGE